jgi:hypothetical protein
MGTKQQEVKDRVYHGWWTEAPGVGDRVISVEAPQRDYWEGNAVRELGRLGSHAQFHWGYDGGGPMEAAELILCDALGVTDAAGKMRSDFANDFTEIFAPEWRLRRGAVLRWVRGWSAEHKVRPEATVPGARARLT